MEFEIDRAALLETFAVEAQELVDELERGLLALEAAPGEAERLHALFRAAHSVKGGAATAGLDGVRDVAHELEGVLERLRAGSSPVTPATISLLLGAVDALRSAVPEVAAGHDLDPAAGAALRERLREATAAGPEATASLTSPGPARQGTATLRVAVERLDRMVDLAGEIAVARGRLGDMLEREGGATLAEILEVHRQSDRLFLDLQELVMQARLVPIGPVLRQQLRTARDAAAATGKEVRLEIEGAEVDVDTAIVQGLRDPLTHLVRNAVDHGIEPAAARRAAGKDGVGRVTLRARREAAGIVVEVADDGRGLDRDRIASRAAAMGLVAEAGQASAEEVQRLVFQPGLSTSERVSAISGRGVGMDVVRRNVEALRGTASVESAPGRGTTVVLRLPLTLAIIQAFRVVAGGQVFIVPLEAMVECVELPRGADERDGRGVLPLRGQPLPYLRLRSRFALEAAPAARESVVVVRNGAALVGLVVDGLLGEGQVVVKPLGRLFRGVKGLAGATILGDGRVALILDVAGLFRAPADDGPQAAGGRS